MKKEELYVEEEEEIDDDFTCSRYFVIATGKACISAIQSRFYWGYNRAAFAMKQLEEKGVVGPITKGERYRKVLIAEDVDVKEGEDVEVEEDCFDLSDEDIIYEYKNDFKNDYGLAVDYVHSTGKASSSSLQSEFMWGYNKSARIIAKLQENGIVGPSREGERYRKVLTLTREPGYVSSDEE